MACPYDDFFTASQPWESRAPSPRRMGRGEGVWGARLPGSRPALHDAAAPRLDGG